MSTLEPRRDPVRTALLACVALLVLALALPAMRLVYVAHLHPYATVAAGARN